MPFPKLIVTVSINILYILSYWLSAAEYLFRSSC